MRIYATVKLLGFPEDYETYYRTEEKPKCFYTLKPINGHSLISIFHRTVVNDVRIDHLKTQTMFFIPKG